MPKCKSGDRVHYYLDRHGILEQGNGRVIRFYEQDGGYWYDIDCGEGNVALMVNECELILINHIPE